jgi:transposase
MLTVDKQHSNLMNYKTFIGADISKETIDFSIVQDGQELLHEKVLNDSKKIESFLKTLKKNQLLSEPVFCMEFTGIYNNILTLVLSKHQIPQVIESALNIKFSQGVQRGKDDRIDAKRIALYAFKNRDNLKLWSPTDQVLDDLKALVGLRKRIISNINRLKVPLGEAKFHSKETLKKMFA